ncbi:MAG: cytochrome C [Flavobacterium sp.]|nr:MAG: cytochrome C [Flavobacterium sp.]
MKVFKKILIGLLVVFVLIQFYRPARNEYHGVVPAADISKSYNVPAAQMAVLKTSCYDCHSNNTVYPWYANIQPVRFWLDDHISEGKRELNFSEFGNYPKKKQIRKLKSTVKEIKDGEMPLASYTLIHRDAALTDNEKIALITWAKSLQDSLGSH